MIPKLSCTPCAAARTRFARISTPWLESSDVNTFLGALGKGPGRNALLLLMPPLVIADLGAGEGTFSQLLARRAKKVIAIDNSEKMVEYGAELARKHGVDNLEYRSTGDIEEVPDPHRHGRSGLLQPGAPPRSTSPTGRRRGASNFEARRPHRGSGSPAPQLSGSPRHVRRRLVRVHGSRSWPAFCAMPGSKASKSPSFIAKKNPPHFETLLAVGNK